MSFPLQLETSYVLLLLIRFHIIRLKLVLSSSARLCTYKTLLKTVEFME